MSLHRLLMSGVVSGGLLWATGASATIYSVAVTGTITAELACSPDSVNTCVDANLAVGDQLVFSARFDSSRVQQWGSLGVRSGRPLWPADQRCGVLARDRARRLAVDQP